MKPDPPVGGPTPEIYSPRKARAHRGMSSLYIQTFTVRAERTGQNGHLKINQTNANQDDSSMAVSTCLLYTSPSPRDQRGSRMPSSA